MTDPTPTPVDPAVVVDPSVVTDPAPVATVPEPTAVPPTASLQTEADELVQVAKTDAEGILERLRRVVSWHTGNKASVIQDLVTDLEKLVGYTPPVETPPIVPAPADSTVQTG